MRFGKGEPASPKIIGDVFRVVSTVIMIALSILAVSWITLGDEWDKIIKSSNFPIKELSAKHWENSIESLRIHESKEYVESVMGIPQVCEKKRTGEIGFSEKQIVEYEKSVYINDFYSLYCVYVDETLVGYLVVSNDERFRPSCYRASFSILDETIASAASRCDELKMINMCIVAGDSNRIDNNAYYLECKMQHQYGGGESVYVGYGVTDIGILPESSNIGALLRENQSMFSSLLHDRIMANNNVVTKISGTELLTKEVAAITQDENLSIRQEKINAYLVFDDFGGKGFELLRDSLMTKSFLGINRDLYSSFVEGYPRSYMPA